MNFCDICNINSCIKCERKGFGEHRHVCYGCATGSGEVYRL